MVESEISSQ